MRGLLGGAAKGSDKGGPPEGAAAVGSQGRETMDFAIAC